MTMPNDAEFMHQMNIPNRPTDRAMPSFTEFMRTELQRLSYRRLEGAPIFESPHQVARIYGVNTFIINDYVDGIAYSVLPSGTRVSFPLSQAPGFTIPFSVSVPAPYPTYAEL